MLLGGASEAATGEVISPESALTFHAWWRGVNLISQKCAAAPKHVYRRTGDTAGDGKEKAYDHPASWLINDQSNEEQTAFDFWLQIMGHAVNRGNGYAVIYRRNGVPVELIPMDPDTTYPVRENGKLWYYVIPIGGHEDRKIEAKDVLHIKGLGFDGLRGYSVYHVARDEIGLGRAERKQESVRFRSGGRYSVMLETDQVIPEDAKTRLRNDWERMHSGVDNWYRTAILDRGLKARSIAPNAEELQQLGLASMSIIAIANFLGTPPTKLGHPEKNYATLEQEESAFIGDGLDFWFTAIDTQNTSKLLTEAERRSGHEAKCNREAMLRPDAKTKAEVLRVLTSGKPIMTQNEARRKLDLPRHEEETADELGTPLNFGQGGDQNTPRDNADPPAGRPPRNMRDAAAKSVMHSTTKLVRRVSFWADRFKSRPADFLTWLDKLQAEHAEVFREEMSAPLQVCRSVNAVSVEEPGRELLDMIHGRYSALVESTSEKDFATAVTAEIKAQERTLSGEMVRLMLGMPK